LLLLDDEVTEWMIGARFALVGGAASAYIGRRMIESSHVRQERVRDDDRPYLEKRLGDDSYKDVPR
jgi:hypothetical protein